MHCLAAAHNYFAQMLFAVAMKKRRFLIASVLVVAVILSSLFIVHKPSGLPRIPLPDLSRRPPPPELVNYDEKCYDLHFPDLVARHSAASAAVWQCKSIPEAEYSFPNKTFLMLKTGAEVLWERLPVHFQTTLKRYPHHALYSDGGGEIGGLEIVDTLAELPDEIMQTDQLKTYRVRQKSIDENWGWSAEDIKSGDGWENDRYKNVPMLLHGWRTAPAETEWFMFIDDDTFMVTESIANLVQPFDPKGHYYFGTPAISGGEFPKSGRVGERLKAESPNGEVTMAFAHGGTGAVISRGALDAVFGGKSDEELKQMLDHYAIMNKHECCGDAMVAYMLREEIELFLNAALPELYSWPYGGGDLKTTRVYRDNWCLPLRSFHHIKSWEIDVLHKWESSLALRRRHLDYAHARPGTPNPEDDAPRPNSARHWNDHDREAHHKQRAILLSDFYRDFILPYLSEAREGWEIFPDSDSPTFHDDSEPLVTESGQVIRPASDREHCSKACELNKKCLGWQWTRGECKLEVKGVVRGLAVNENGRKEDSRKIWSGYNFARILDIRNDAKCDPYHSEESYHSERSEGWYLRELQEEREYLETQSHKSNAVKNDTKGDQ